MGSVFSKEVQAILKLPTFARMATLMPDGSPQITVMWFRQDGNSLRMVTPADSAKATNLERDPRVAVIVEEPGNPYNFVEIRGTAEVVHDDAPARAELRRIAERYIGERASSYVAGLSHDPRVILVIHPEKTTYHRGTSAGPEPDEQ